MQMAMPPAPWSPMPRIDSLSVATIRRTGSSPAASFKTRAMRPRKSGVSHTPRARRNTWLKLRVASATVGV